jgi:hypothetical protein
MAVVSMEELGKVKKKKIIASLGFEAATFQLVA